MGGVWSNRLVPILAVTDLPQEEDPPITGSEQVLATRYYLRVHLPHRGIPGAVPPQRWDVPMAGITAGIARLLLPPSVGYGANASYRVEYVAWRPVINATPIKVANGGTRARVRVPERVVREEYWHIPHDRLDAVLLSMVHLTDRDPLPVAVIDPLSVRTPSGEPLVWDIVQRPLEGTYDNSLRDITISVGVPIGQEYVIEYRAPLTLRDVQVHPNDRTHTEDICRDSSLCCPPLVAPWGRLPSTQVISTRWY